MIVFQLQFSICHAGLLLFKKILAFSTSFMPCDYQLDDSIVTSSILQDCANINSVWASLIVEECSRLGLTVRTDFHLYLSALLYTHLIFFSFQYFCIAPGSRSSPLAVAASTHPHITCIACYDERSLAFHAIGYARGSQIPAVVITTSGTAVSNLFPAVSSS